MHLALMALAFLLPLVAQSETCDVSLPPGSGGWKFSSGFPWAEQLTSALGKSAVQPPTEARVCDARSFGAKGNGLADDTLAVQRAVDSCAREGGGMVILQNGVFLTGTIRLKSGIHLRIEKGATLKGKQDSASYPSLYPNTRNSELKDARKALVYVGEARGVKISGGGTIDGSGHNPAWKGHESTRPMGIFMALSKDLEIRDITVKDAGMWGVVGLESENLHIQRLTVDSTIFPNRDGIDLVDSHHVLIEDSAVSSDDDAICLKSGSAKGVQDVTVRNTVIHRTGSNALKLGTASHGSFSGIRFENIRIEQAYKAAMAVMSVDGGSIRDVEFKNIHFENTGSAFFVLLGRRLLSAEVGSIDGLKFERIRGTTNQSWGSVISGTQGLISEHRIGSVELSDVEVRAGLPRMNGGSVPREYWGQYPDPPMWGDLPTDSIYIRHADPVKMKDVRFLPFGG